MYATMDISGEIALNRSALGHSTTSSPGVGQIVSDRTRELFEVVNYVFLCSLVSLFGIVTNVINIIIFFKQGFDNTMNISFFGLAISDLCSLITLQWHDICVNPLFVRSKVPIDAIEISHLTAAWPHTCFSRITGWVTAYITAERCLCIAAPLKVKKIITPKRAAVILSFIFIINLLTLVPEYSTAYYGWKYNPVRNRTLLGLKFKGDRVKMAGISFFLHAALAMMAFGAVVAFTVILAVKLTQKSRWRAMSISTKQAELTSVKDKKAIKMTVLISGILITMYTPAAIFAMVTFSEPEVSVTGKYCNIFVVMWSFGFLCEAINSSANIFLYYRMSSKYRQTFQELFRGCRRH